MISATPMTFDQIFGPSSHAIQVPPAPTIDYNNSWQPVVPFVIGFIAGVIITWSIIASKKSNTIPLPSLKTNENENSTDTLGSPEAERSGITEPNTGSTPTTAAKPTITSEQIAEEHRQRVAKRKEQRANAARV